MLMTHIFDPIIYLLGHTQILLFQHVIFNFKNYGDILHIFGLRLWNLGCILDLELISNKMLNFHWK